MDIIDELNEACVGHPHAKIAWPHRVLHGAREEIERARQRITYLLGINNEFEAIARAARANLRASVEALGEIEPRWRKLEWDMQTLTTPRPIEEYHEDMGTVLWWKFPIVEAPYVGTPNDFGYTVEVRLASSDDPSAQLLTRHVGGWPGYHTHFTPLPTPETP